MDIIKQLGTLALASRLKRLSENLMSEVDRLYKEQDVIFHPRWFPVAYVLKQKSPMAITEIAEALGMTHPAINQTAGQMSRHGMLVSQKDKKDERRRLLALSKKGKETVKALEPLWIVIRECTDAILETTGRDFIDAITKIEEQLEKENIYNRVKYRMLKDIYNQLKIIDYESSYKKYFKKLNYEWLNKYFKVEKYDSKVLSDPEKYVIKTGGVILFASLNGEIVGTGALIKHNDRLYEIAKMAVTEKAQGKHIGLCLAKALIEKAKKLGAEEILIATSSKLKAAKGLYSQLGFIQTEKPPYYPYEFKRPTIFMKLTFMK